MTRNIYCKLNPFQGSVLMDISHPRISYGASQIQPLRGSGLFARMHLVEQVGSGINRMNDLMKTAGLTNPVYNTDGMFTVILLRSARTVEETVEETAVKTIITLIKSNPKVTAKEMSNATGLTRRGVEYHLTKLKEQGKLVRIGSTKMGSWEIIE